MKTSEAAAKRAQGANPGMYGDEGDNPFAQAGESKSVVIQRNRFGAFTLTPIGLEVEGSASQSDWHEVGAFLFSMDKSIQWLIGDWLVYGEQLDWGDIKRIAAESGRNYASLRQYAYVSRNVSMRIDKLTWNHHLLVAKLPDNEQAQALQYAADNELSVKAFNEWLNPTALPSPALSVDDIKLLSSFVRAIKKNQLSGIDPGDMILLRKIFDRAEQLYKNTKT